ncbi:MAG: hypothetical protein ACLFP8_02840 [Alphaproteobacteria bacterium]
MGYIKMGHTFEILVRSYEVIDPIITEPAVHNEISFREYGDITLSLNGEAWDRETGLVNVCSMSGDDSLRISSISNGSYEDLLKQSGNSESFPLVSEVTLFASSDPREFDVYLAKALEVSEFINSQNMDYIMLCGFGCPGQNSNSAAHTIAEAMGLKYPPEAENLWAPGHDRVLLPTQWRSVFDGSHSDSSLYSYIQDAITRLTRHAVSLEVKNDPNPYADQQVFSFHRGGEDRFDPANIKSAGEYFDLNAPYSFRPHLEPNPYTITYDDSSSQPSPYTTVIVVEP